MIEVNCVSNHCRNDRIWLQILRHTLSIDNGVFGQMDRYMDRVKGKHALWHVFLIMDKWWGLLCTDFTNFHTWSLSEMHSRSTLDSTDQMLKVNTRRWWWDSNNNNWIQRRNSRFWQSPSCAVNHLQHVRSSGPGAIVCKSRATHRALITCNMSFMCHVVRRDNSATKFNRVQIAFIELYFISWTINWWRIHHSYYC